MRKRIERDTDKQIRKKCMYQRQVKNHFPPLPVSRHVGIIFFKKLHCQPSSEESFRYMEEAAGWHKPEDRGRQRGDHLVQSRAKQQVNQKGLLCVCMCVCGCSIYHEKLHEDKYKQGEFFPSFWESRARMRDEQPVLTFTTSL